MKWLLSFILQLTSVLTFFVCICLYLLLIVFFSPYWIQPLTHLICRLILLSSGQWLVIEGKQPTTGRAYLFLSNHQSLLDAFIFGAALSGKVTAVAAEDYFAIPIWGTIMRRYGVIPIQRKVHNQAMSSMRIARVAVMAGVSMVMCPEGTRTKTGHIAEFKKGAFHLALDTWPIIVPLAIIGAYEARNRNSWLIHPSVIKLRFGRQIPPEEYAGLDPAELADFVRREIISLST